MAHTIDRKGQYVEARIWLILDKDATITEDDEIVKDFREGLKALAKDLAQQYYPIIQNGYVEEIGNSFVKEDDFR